MPPFEKPSFSYDYDVSTQIAALRQWEGTKPGRDIPDKHSTNLLLATWNIANLGLQERRPQDYEVIGEIVSWFDLIAVQEVNDDLEGLKAIQARLPNQYRVLFSDKAGNKERLTFIYDSNKVTLLEKVGEIAIPPSESSAIKLVGTTQKFDGFDRNPYLAAFRSGNFTLLLVNVHLYFGSEKSDPSKRDMNRRCLETYAVARWADLRRKSPYAYTRNIIALGDFNLPKLDAGDPVYSALTRRGLHLPQHSTQMGSNLAGDKHYDQIAFFPGPTQAACLRSGVFDFDGSIFRTLWDDPQRSKQDFFNYVRYYISDHRPLWAEFQI